MKKEIVAIKIKMDEILFLFINEHNINIRNNIDIGLGNY